VATTTIEVEDMITVGTLADKLMIPVSRLIGELMKNGILATLNERIDFDTAQIMVQELGLDIELVKKTTDQGQKPKRQKVAVSSKAEPRPPVVAVMGHVDHGKTSLLDAIRSSDVVQGEAGGITQHISAYQIEHHNRLITLLDTPGHEAFAAIREHGAQLTDIVVLVVAADDGIKPQTIEAIRYARQAGVKIIVAINKIDKTGADPAHVKQQLSEQDLLIEEWGGDIIVQEVSAKTKQGITELLDMILLVSDVEDLKADTDVPARGLIIESHIEQGRGPVAHALVEAGVLGVGDFVVAGSSYAKIRTLSTTTGQPLKQAGPSTPVAITGFKSLPEFGDQFESVISEKAARELTQKTATEHQITGGRLGLSSSELIRLINREHRLQEFKIIVKADVQGSLTSVVDSLKTLGTDEVAIRLVGSGVGAITENDLHLALTSNSIIYGFNITAASNIRQQAARDKIQLRLYNVIYELIDNVKSELSTLLKPEIVETDLGRLIIRGIFKTTKSEVICGGEVTKGKLIAPSSAKVFRDDKQLMEVEITNLKRGPQDTKEILEGEMCGLSLQTPSRLEIQVGDRVEVFKRETIERQL